MKTDSPLLLHAILAFIIPFPCSFAWIGHHRPPPNFLSRKLEEETNKAGTPLEFCEVDCNCEECAEYLTEYQATCLCEEQPDGSVLQIGSQDCLSRVNGTDVCYFYSFTDTVKASSDSGVAGWAGFYQYCAVVGDDEFCMSTDDQNAPPPAECKATVNGVKCNSCFDIFSQSPTLEMDCTNIVEGALMKISEDRSATGFVGIFEAAGVALMAEEEYAVCPGDPEFPTNNKIHEDPKIPSDDTSGGLRSSLRCMAIVALAVVSVVFV